MSTIFKNYKCDNCRNGIVMLKTIKGKLGETTEIQRCNVCKKWLTKVQFAHLKEIRLLPQGIAKRHPVYTVPGNLDFDVYKKEYPQALEKFNTWFERYGEENNFRDLFNVGDFDEFTKDNVRFDQLPYEMQFGIFFKFCIDEFKEDFQNYIDCEEMMMMAEGCFEEIENHFKASNN